MTANVIVVRARIADKSELTAAARSSGNSHQKFPSPGGKTASRKPPSVARWEIVKEFIIFVGILSILRPGRIVVALRALEEFLLFGDTARDA